LLQRKFSHDKPIETSLRGQRPVVWRNRETVRR
jgi:hypothetical protein